MKRLVIYEGSEMLAEHELVQSLVRLGRHPDNDIVLNDRTLSRYHARIEKRAEAYVVVDPGSQNGVHKNGERIDDESPLESGDRIELGRYVAVYEVIAKAKGAKPTNGVPGNGAHLPNGKKSKDNAPAIDIDVDVDVDLDVDLGADLGVDLEADPLGIGLEGDIVGFDPDTDARSNKDENETDHVSDFEADAASVEFVPPKPMCIVLLNSQEISRHPLTDAGITIGRSKHCEVVIGLLGLSRKHAKIFASEDGFVIKDLDSQNGTWVNNERIEGSRVLRHGDLMNFYDYGVLFLEDADVDVGLPEAQFSVAGQAGLNSVPAGVRSAQETERAPQVPVGKSRQTPPTKAPARADQNRPEGGLVDLKPNSVDATEFGLVGRSKKKRSGVRENDGDDSLLDLADLGEGSLFGEESEGGAGKAQKSAKAAVGQGTELIEPGEVIEAGVDGDDDAEVAFAASAAAAAADFGRSQSTAGDLGVLADRTTTGLDVHAFGGCWPTDSELERALVLNNESLTVTLDVKLKGKLYAQIPLSQAITRVGADSRCEVALQKSADLRPWHCTLFLLGGAVMVQRANRTALVEIRGKEVDVAMLKNNDTVKIGHVEIQVRFRK